MPTSPRKTTRRAFNPKFHVSIIVRYDVDRKKWIHSAGLMLSARESAVMWALAHYNDQKTMAKALCCSESSIENAMYHLKRRFNIANPATQSARIALRAIAIDLF